jgi:uncharacterized Ntn-hydrolase superfamily protein
MTFTILGRDPDSGELGIAIATYSLAVGASCPQILPGIGVLTSQASTNPAIGEEVMELLEDGVDPVSALMQALASDPFPDSRQVALLTPTGEPLIHSGANTKPFSGHITDIDCVAVGNFLDSESVLTAMVAGFENEEEMAGNPSLARKLLAALRAGKEAGGQAGSDGDRLPERSACILIGGLGERFPTDIRIDVSDDAIPALQQAFDAYTPMHEYYLARAENPTDLPSQDVWVKNLGEK